MFRGETALYAGAIQQFLRGAFFLGRLPITPCTRYKVIQEKPVTLFDRQPSQRVSGPCTVCTVTARAKDEAMRNQFCNGCAQRMFATNAEAIAPLERRLQMAVVLLGQLAGKKNKQGLCCRL